MECTLLTDPLYVQFSFTLSFSVIYFTNNHNKVEHVTCICPSDRSFNSVAIYYNYSLTVLIIFKITQQLLLIYKSILSIVYLV